MSGVSRDSVEKIWEYHPKKKLLFKKTFKIEVLAHKNNYIQEIFGFQALISFSVLQSKYLLLPGIINHLIKCLRYNIKPLLLESNEN